jgi:hypothetical protein
MMGRSVSLDRKYYQWKNKPPLAQGVAWFEEREALKIYDMGID